MVRVALLGGRGAALVGVAAAVAVRVPEFRDDRVGGFLEQLSRLRDEPAALFGVADAVTVGVVGFGVDAVGHFLDDPLRLRDRSAALFGVADAVTVAVGELLANLFERVPRVAHACLVSVATPALHRGGVEVGVPARVFGLRLGLDVIVLRLHVIGDRALVLNVVEV